MRRHEQGKAGGMTIYGLFGAAAIGALTGVLFFGAAIVFALYTLFAAR